MLLLLVTIKIGVLKGKIGKGDDTKIRDGGKQQFAPRMKGGMVPLRKDQINIKTISRKIKFFSRI